MRILPILVLAGLLAGCTGLTNRNPPRAVTQYDLGPVVLNVPQDARPWRIVVSSVISVDSTAMRYRLLFDDPAKVLDFSQARWSTAPSEVMRRRLEAQLFWPAGKASSCAVHLELQKFEQVFASTSASSGVLAVRAELRQPGGRILDERYFTFDVEAPSADAPGGVTALGLATDQLAAGLRLWQEQGISQELWKACRP